MLLLLLLLLPLLLLDVTLFCVAPLALGLGLQPALLLLAGLLRLPSCLLSPFGLSHLLELADECRDLLLKGIGGGHGGGCGLKFLFERDAFFTPKSCDPANSTQV